MTSSSAFNATMHTPSSPEVTWIATRFNPYVWARSHLEELARREALVPSTPRVEATNHGARGQNGANLSPRAQRAMRRHTFAGGPIVIDLTNPRNKRRTPPVVIDLTLSPRAQREMQRIEEYNRQRESRQAMRRIIKVIQDKRREEFRFFPLHACLTLYRL
ncbi:uncharacterized protein MELLADRAFT_70304 [Melampsora larici-populina 98AG31]|uniref:Uncharacterized protein n=1 Tax=Melampsora larici-populina (strain 98AG31 / pathotype 3-4-7) TaxID=747676 RepID=F4SEE9_MELLP|nr:uncharacterized protein MELLADRAFT_70304 [Melampsora larici-populina 98AG31]EGF96978.1 hypothetical protein MELLADRAFT_70304 [Melampsora larici-populina 98AG31]